LKTKINQILNEYKTEISRIEKGSLDDFKNIEEGLIISRAYIKKLRLLLRKRKFRTKNDEIEFFKEQKPFINSYIKFYSKLYRFLLKKPKGSLQKQRAYIDEEIEKLQEDYKKNLDFVKYYRENSTYLDQYYFLRGKDEVRLITDTSHYLTDEEFSTSHDNLVAKIKAFDLLVSHYEKLLEELRFKENNVEQGVKIQNSCSNENLQWTASKTDLVELIYALNASNVIDNGNLDIKRIATLCEKMFNVKLGNFYKTYSEIKSRKNNRTTFLDKLKISLEQKMDFDDSEY